MSTRPRSLHRILCAFVALLLASAPCIFAADDTKPQPVELDGIKNAFRVTGRILSGSQPKLELSFAALARAGVKTIISVDGSRPDVATAKKFGIRYVHLPFGYDGVPAGRIAELAKATAPEAGKIFIHCHHGLHRGPAAVGVVCEAIAGWTPAQAEAWMKQAGTSPDYPGLYRAVREFRAPPPDAVAQAGPLTETVKPPALVDSMVAIDECLDLLRNQQRAGWRSVPENPDTLPAHQATLLQEQLRELGRTEETANRPDDFRKRLAESEQAVSALRESLRTFPNDGRRLDRALSQVTQSCTACHKAFRNVRSEKP